MTVKTKSILCLLTLLLLVSGVGMASYDDRASGVNYRDGDASPSASESNINNYLYQDEQINVAPDDGELRVGRFNQKVLMNEFVTKLIPVKNVAVRELRPIARAICAKEGGYAQVVQDKVKKQYWVEVTCPPWQLPYVEAAITALDKDWLNATDSGSAILRYDGKNRDVGVPDSIARAYLGAGSATTAIDSLENSATHLDNVANVGAWEKLMQAMDLPEHQIKVDVEMVEVNTNNDLKLGVDYIAWKNGPGRNLFEFIFAGMKNKEHFRGASSIFNALPPTHDIYSDKDHVRFNSGGRQEYANYNYWLTSAYFDFLKSKGYAKSLMRTTLRAKSGEYAQEGEVTQVLSFSVTGTNDKYLYPYTYRANAYKIGDMSDDYYEDGVRVAPTQGAAQHGDGGDLGAWDRFVNYVNSGHDVGMFVTILPMIGLESTEMYVDARISEVTGYTPAGLPTIAERSLTTDVRVMDGSTLLLAGLKRTEDVKQKAGAPWLADIPVLGYIFGGETSLDRATDVVVSMTTATGVQAEEMTKDIVMAESEKLVVNQAQGLEPLDMPANKFGFDQWLLDPAKSGSEK